MNETSKIDRPSLKRRAIQQIPLFAVLSESEQENLIDMLVLREYAKGQSILVSAEEGSDIMFVADGAVDVKRSGRGGREVIVARLSTGEFFGEIAFLTKTRRSADVIAAEDAMVLQLRAGDFENLLSSNVRFARSLMLHLAQRVAAASTRISDLALLDVYCRVHGALSSLAKLDPVTKNLVVKERPTHKELAAMVGTSREMVTRALTKLQEDEVIAIEDKAVSILSSVALED